MDAEDAPHAPHFGASLVDMLDVMAVGRVGALFYNQNGGLSLREMRKMRSRQTPKEVVWKRAIRNTLIINLPNITYYLTSICTTLII